METLLYGRTTWVPRREHYKVLRSIHYGLLPGIIEYHRLRGTPRGTPAWHVPTVTLALKNISPLKPSSGNDEWRLLFARALARQPDERLPKRLRPEHPWGRGGHPGPGCTKQKCLKCLGDDLHAIGAQTALRTTADRHYHLKASSGCQQRRKRTVACGGAATRRKVQISTTKVRWLRGEGKAGGGREMRKPMWPRRAGGGRPKV